MSLVNTIGMESVDVDPGYIDDAAMESLCAATLLENLNPEELEEFVTESADFEIVTEKNIVKLDKNARMSRAYKVGILQCAAEDNRKEYKKLRKLWKMEAVLFNKLEKIYSNKAKAKAREAMKKAKRSTSNVVVKAGNRASKALGGTGKFLKGGIIKPKKR